MSDLVDPPHAELAPDEIAGRSFPSARRGLDADAVRRFLAEIAAQMRAQREREALARAALSDLEARLLAAQERAATAERAAARELDEATLTAALGTETAKVLRAAHDAAREVVAKAEARAGELTGAAQEIVAKQSALAKEEADRILQSARSEAESLISDARGDCRHMVEEAREARRRILTDLADRRRHLHVQLEQIRAAKDALVEIVDRTAGSVEDIRRQLTGSEDAARQAAEGAAGLAGALLADAVPIEQLVAEVLAGPAPVPSESALEPETPSPTDVVPVEADVTSARLDAKDGSSPGSAAAGLSGRDGDDLEELTLRDGLAQDAVLAGVEPAPGEVGAELAPTDQAVSEQALSDGAEPAGALALVVAGSEGGAVSEALVVEWIEPSVATEAHDDAPAAPEQVAPPAPDELAPAGAEAAAPPPPGEEPTANWEAEGEDAPAGGEVPASDAETVATIEGSKDANGARAGGVPSAVDELFAKIRASRAQEVAEARAVLGAEREDGNVAPAVRAEGAPVADAAPANSASPAPASEGEIPAAGTRAAGEGEDGSDQEPAPGIGARRDALLAPAVGELARSLKRTLRSQQNELLAATRSSGGDGLGDLLASEEVAAEIARGARPQLINAYVVGIEFAADVLGEARSDVAPLVIPEAGLVEAEIEPVVRSLADEVVGRIVEQLAAPASAGQEDPARLVGAAFREWKGERVDQLVGDAANRAFSLGILGHSMRSEVPVVWDLAENEQPCPECDDNALAEDQRPGAAFPTGHLSPPAHPGCRCVVVPVAG
ncbi:MAG: DivIVA domain-containing protein [Actinomycetota bacterium]|nr:DivIVA domain-containing protein [Actinomycetota bacterium]